MSKATIRPSWPGFDHLKYLFVFGASYCSMSFTPFEPVPTEELPFGIENPVTFALPPPEKSHTLGPGFSNSEPSETETLPKAYPNWVMYLTREERISRNQPRLLVYDYAVGGSTVRDVQNQVQKRFIPGAGKKGENALWTGQNSLFCIWVGINDLAYRETDHSGADTVGPTLIKEAMDILFNDYGAALSNLYKAGARNFLLVNVPQMNKSPGSSKLILEDTRYRNWNTALEASLDSFANTHPQASTFLFSSFDTVKDILDNPTQYDFDPSDLRKHGGGIWVDHIHPTSAVHKIVAGRMAEFLVSHEPLTST